MSLKTWLLKKQLKKKIGLICAFLCAFLGVILTSIALLLDILTDLGKAGDVEVSCGWQGISNVDTKFGVACDAGDDDYCKSKTSGEAWLSFEIISVTFALGACIMIAVKKQFTKYLFIICGIACICGVISWVADNPICYGDQLPTRELGASCIIAIVCGFFYFIAAFCSALKREKGGYTVLK